MLFMPKKKITPKQENLVKVLYSKNLSGPEISKQLRISLKQVYDSLRRQQIHRKSAFEQNKVRFDKKPPSFSFKRKLSIKEKELLVAGVMLYYGEGAKSGFTVDFANGDMRLLKLFLKFLKIICKVNEKRLRFYLYCFSDQNTKTLIRFWCSQLGVERSQFTKPYVRSTFNKGKRTLKNGILHIRYSDKRLLEKILCLGDELSSTL